MIQQYHVWVNRPQRTESRVSRRYLYPHVHSNISQKVEVTHVSISSQTDTPDVVYTHNGILFSLKKEGNSDTSCMEEL